MLISGLTTVYLPYLAAHLQVSVDPLGLDPRLGFLLLGGCEKEKEVKYLGERWIS